MNEATFILGTFFLVWMIQTSTTKQLKKMKRLELMFIQQRKSGLSVAEFCKRKGIHQSKFYYWKKRYEERKEAGLIDHRRGISYKVTKERRKFIIQYKIKNPLASCREIAHQFEIRFKISLDYSHLAQILREENINAPPGRKTGKPVKKKLQSD